MKKNKYGGWLACIGFAAAVTAILWITLISRPQEEARKILPPLWSYAAIAGGNKRVLLENGLNILLFLPVGLCLPVLWKTKGKQVACIAFLGSLFIEAMQLLCKVGFFEVDDLLHNTLGALLGYGVIRICRIPALTMPRQRSLRIFALAAALLIGASILGQRGYTDFHAKKMCAYAARNDREDTPNRLVLNGKNGYAGNSKVYVRYGKDGSISISGTSDVRTWKLLAELELEKGSYSFSGLSGVAEKTVAIELEYYDTEKEKFIRLTEDVGFIDEVFFSLPKKTKIRAYVGVYKGCDCNVIARPVIYREGD